jgi:hypothetical protein|tara:strand:+ start:2240 stop:2644 length:405 start_codon:yes stop_codon:yes gene_type:complete
MKKAKEVKYGIEITKPWSKEMYAHNEEVQNEICDTILEMWEEAYGLAESDFEEDLEEDQKGLEFSDSDWDNANQAMMNIQLAVTFSFLGYGFTIADVQDNIYRELDDIREMGYRAKEIAEELELKLEKEIIGFQ